jgi:hypothetical protein
MLPATADDLPRLKIKESLRAWLCRVGHCTRADPRLVDVIVRKTQRYVYSLGLQAVEGRARENRARSRNRRPLVDLKLRHLERPEGNL